MKLQVLLFPVMLASFGVFAEDQSPPADPPKEAPVAAPAATFTPVNDVVKMFNAGIDEKAIVTFINNAPGFKVGAEDVIALHQGGVSFAVINAMLQHPARPDATEKPVPPPPPTVATVTSASGPNAPIIYPTPAKEAVPLTDPVVVLYPYGGSSVLIVGSPYSYAAGNGYGGYAVRAGCYEYGASGYGCYRGSRCRF